MDLPSESYRFFLRLFYPDLLKLLNSPKLNSSASTTRAPSSGTRRTEKLASLANSTLEITKAARPATTLLIAPLAGTCWTRSGGSSSTPTSTAPPQAGKLESNTVKFLLSISTLLLLLRLVLLSRRSIISWLVFGADRCFDRWAAVKVHLFLPPHPFVRIADDGEARALASCSTAHSSATSSPPLCPLSLVLVS